MNDNYVLTHLHSQYSLLDSVTPFEAYVDWAVEHGQKAIASTEHGVIYNWTNKKAYCDKKGIKYIHGVELYMTAQLYHARTKVVNGSNGFSCENVTQKFRDNYHVVLLAKNLQGIKEINQLVSIANDADHFYFKPRITFEEMLNISDNVIICSACMKSPLWSYKYVIKQYESEIEEIKIDTANLQTQLQSLQQELEGANTIRKKKRKPEVIANEISEVENGIKCNDRNIELITADIGYLHTIIDSVMRKYTYLEVQPHVNSEEQKVFNKQLLQWSSDFGIPIICGTDTHSLNQYLAECRTILQTAKRIEFDNEDTFDLTVKTYAELYEMFKEQGVLTDEQIKEALHNTEVLADSVEDFELDKSFKYPIFKNPEEDALMFRQKCRDGFNAKLKSGAINPEQKQEYIDRVKTELTALEQVGMMGFMLSMSEFIGKLRAQGIPFGPARGSAGGSLVAYLTDITDCDPIVWGLSFERFCNKDRISLGD